MWNSYPSRLKRRLATIVAMLLLLCALPAAAEALPAGANRMCPVTPDEPADPQYVVEHEGERVYLCCGRCRQQFKDDPQRYMAELAAMREQAGEADADEQAEPADASPDDAELEPVPRTLDWLGRLHPAAAHFPIALIVAAGVAELLGGMSGRVWLLDAGRFCLWFGAVGALVAAPLGWLNAGFDVGGDDAVLASHRWLGTFAVIGVIALVVLLEVARRKQTRGARWIYRGALLLGVVAIGLVGHLGGMLVYGTDYYAW